MIATLTDALDQACSDGHDGLWACGDMTWEFGPNRDFSKLLEYEYRLEDPWFVGRRLVFNRRVPHPSAVFAWWVPRPLGLRDLADD